MALIDPEQVFVSLRVRGLVGLLLAHLIRARVPFHGEHDKGMSAMIQDDLMETLRIARRQVPRGSAPWWWEKRIDDLSAVLVGTMDESLRMKASIGLLADLLLKSEAIKDQKTVDALVELSTWKPPQT